MQLRLSSMSVVNLTNDILFADYGRPETGNNILWV